MREKHTTTVSTWCFTAKMNGEVMMPLQLRIFWLLTLKKTELKNNEEPDRHNNIQLEGDYLMGDQVYVDNQLMSVVSRSTVIYGQSDAPLAAAAISLVEIQRAQIRQL